MGIKQAAAYFQMQMSQVLHERLGDGIEIYLDDIIFYAETFEEYTDILRFILTKLRKHNIVANPAKTEIAFPVLQILGHTVGRDGVTFDKSKLQGVVKFQKPQTVNQMEQFLGLTTHFRDHVPAGQRSKGIQDITTLERPLRQMMLSAKKSKTTKLVWTDEAETCNLSSQSNTLWSCDTLGSSLISSSSN